MLSELPPELLHLIIGLLSKDPFYISDYCREDVRMDDSRTYFEPAYACWTRRRTLLNLCLTDKKLAGIAREYQYKYFDSLSDEPSFFLRTMVQQPQYREYVRCLRIEPQMDSGEWKCVPCDSFSDSDPSFSDSDWPAFAYHSILHTAGAVSKYFPPLLMHSDMVSDGRFEQENIAQWLLINLRNVEALNITIPENREWAFKIMNHIIQYSGTILPCLQYLKILKPPSRLQPYKWDHMMDLIPVRSLLDLATLKRVDLGCCAEFDPGDHYWDNLKSVSHWRCHSAKCQIARLVSKCPTLESLYLKGTPSKAFNLSCLSGCERTLQRLELDLWNLVPVPLTKFFSLKVIAITTQSIPQNTMVLQELEDLHCEIATNLEASTLACMLPKGLVHLYLDFARIPNGHGLQCQVNHLIIDKLPKLQNLQKVELSWQPSEELRRALSQAGIVSNVFPAEADL